MDGSVTGKQPIARGDDRRTKRDPDYKGPERRTDERRAKAKAPGL